MKRSAFTMLELVFVIIVIGILAVLAMPDFKSNQLQRAAEQVAAHIRYTQHLAMIDDKFDPTDSTYDQNGCATAFPGQWYKSWWRIRFFTLLGEKQYVVFSDKNRCNNIDATGNSEPAIDPFSHKMLYDTGDDRGTEKVNLTKQYKIVAIGSNCDAGNIDILFDNLGRPYAQTPLPNPNPYSHLLTTNCTISLEHQTEGNATITIRPETGYVSISYN